MDITSITNRPNGPLFFSCTPKRNTAVVVLDGERIDVYIRAEYGAPTVLAFG